MALFRFRYVCLLSIITFKNFNFDEKEIKKRGRKQREQKKINFDNEIMKRKRNIILLNYISGISQKEDKKTRNDKN